MALILTELAQRAGSFSPQERLERLAAINAERMNWALMYLSSYAPAVFDTVLDQVDRHGGSTDGRDETESFCARCGQEIEIAPTLALAWRHLGDDDALAGHEPSAAWRPATGLPW
jgi:hypothetical protein